MRETRVKRHEILAAATKASALAVIHRPFKAWEKLYELTAVRKAFILLILAIVWETYARALDNPLLFPSFSATWEALWRAIVSNGLLERVALSLKTLMMGYCAGIAFAALLAGMAMTSRIGTDLLETLTSMFSPLPAIALLPLALLWFGLGYGSIVFVLIHSVLWPVALNTHAGFMAVPNALRMVGRNYGLNSFAYVFKILVPAAFPSIFTGLRIGWAFAWRTLIAAELVFGVNAGSGGLGWFIYENKNRLEIPSVFAGLLTVILIGLSVEVLFFRTIEMRTVRKWGMQR
jgi:NitT/TauT family transport system permease protein